MQIITDKVSLLHFLWNSNYWVWRWSVWNEFHY